jgi:predicted component of type VI protein secretion system
MSTLRLVPASGSPIEITRDEVVVGRDPACDVVLPDGSVSRRHARILRRGPGWAVVDQGSANGTFLDSKRVAEEVLRQGQEVRFGALSFRVEVEGGEDPGATVAGFPQPEVTVVHSSPLVPPSPPPRAPAPPARATAPPPPPPAAPERFRASAPPAPAGHSPSSQVTAPVPQIPAGPPPAKKGKGPLFWFGAGCCGCLLLVLVLALLLGGGAFYMSKGAADAVKAEIQEIKEGRLDQAYESLHPSYRSQLSRGGFDQLVARHPGLRENADSTFWKRSIVNDTATLSGILTPTSGRPEPVTFKLVKEGGVWRISAIEFEDQTSGDTGRALRGSG